MNVSLYYLTEETYLWMFKVPSYQGSRDTAWWQTEVPTAGWFVYGASVKGYRFGDENVNVNWEK